ncbi:MAG: cyanophycinase [Chloroflexota bacterium]|nr:cyanophycinase [Chloroflexota bacterium]
MSLPAGSTPPVTYSPYINPQAPYEAAWQTPGYLMVIGGADRLDPESTIARLFLRLVARVEANSAQRGVVLVSTATRHPEILTSEYIRIFSRLGLDRSQIHAPLIRHRDEAHLHDRTEMLRNAAGIFITGGDQYLLTQVLDRTPAEEAMRDAYKRGAVVAGTSAGATAMGRPMIVAGGGTGEMRLGMVQMSRGLAWAGDDVIVDTHFGARGRFPRLAAAVAEHPRCLGVGVDENTCLLLDGQKNGLVVGSGVVYVVDPAGTVLNTVHGAHSGQTVSLAPLSVSVLAAGATYNIRTRTLQLATAEPAQL